LARQVFAKAVEIRESDDRRRRARFHINTTTSMDVPVFNGSRIRISMPLLGIIDGKLVDVPIKNEASSAQTPWILFRVEQAHEVRRIRLR
jgi:hypothetical protein